MASTSIGYLCVTAVVLALFALMGCLARIPDTTALLAAEQACTVRHGVPILSTSTPQALTDCKFINP